MEHRRGKDHAVGKGHRTVTTVPVTGTQQTGEPRGVGIGRVDLQPTGEQQLKRTIAGAHPKTVSSHENIHRLSDRDRRHRRNPVVGVSQDRPDGYCTRLPQEGADHGAAVQDSHDQPRRRCT